MKLGVKRLFEALAALPKTIYFNLRYFGIEGLKLPVIVSHKVYLKTIKGSVIVPKPFQFGMIRIGFGDVGIFDKHGSRSIWEVAGRVDFLGKTNIGHGSKISVAGELVIGSDFCITAESSIVCGKRIVFGSDVLVSWDTLIMDTDFHIIREREKIINEDREIIIGNHVWIGCRCSILKGVVIADNTVIAANSCIYDNSIEGSNHIIGGNPAKVITRNINWEH